MINVDYPSLVGLIKPFAAKKRTESASFLIWYFNNYYRLDEDESVFSVCDDSGDKGIDGIFVNDNSLTIDVFQTKIVQKPKSTIGDSLLKEFFGTLSQFNSKKEILKLIKSAGKAQVVQLIERLDLLNKIESYSIHGIFLSNVNIDSNGLSFLKGKDNIDFVGKDYLESNYVSDARDPIKNKSADFDIFGLTVSEYIVDDNTKAIIAPIKSTELVNLKGISDQSLFIFNVRGPLGLTSVNKDIVKSIKNNEYHKLFPLFHNGITILCDSLDYNEKTISIKNYFVVNGCQSLSALFNHKSDLTDDLRILTKIIQVKTDSDLPITITKFSNNQNGVKARDFKSNNQIQIRLQNEMNKFYGSEYYYEIKRGEDSKNLNVISNENAGILIWSFDLKEPWNTHRKYQVFEDKYNDIFAQPYINADRIVFLHLLDSIFKEFILKIQNELFGKYAITRYTLFYIIRIILEDDVVGKDLIRTPSSFIREKKTRKIIINTLKTIIGDVIDDINAEIKELSEDSEDFDYKSKLRDEKWVKKLASNIKSINIKLVRRGSIKSFEDEWKKNINL